MLKPEQVPECAMRAMVESMNCEWVMQSPEDLAVVQRHIASALNAWPGMLTERRARCDAVVLPYNLDADLPQEDGDGK